MSNETRGALNDDDIWPQGTNNVPQTHQDVAFQTFLNDAARKEILKNARLKGHIKKIERQNVWMDRFARFGPYISIVSWMLMVVLLVVSAVVGMNPVVFAVLMSILHSAPTSLSIYGAMGVGEGTIDFSQ